MQDVTQTEAFKAAEREALKGSYVDDEPEGETPPVYDHHTYLQWQRNIRLSQAFAQQAPEASPAVAEPTKIERESYKPTVSTTPDLDPIVPAAPSILTEDWFTGFIPRDEGVADGEDETERVRVTDGWGKTIGSETITYYEAPRRTRDAIACDEALVEELQRFEAKPAVGLTERELAVLEQRKLVVEMKAEAKRHYFKRLPKHLPLEFRLAKAEEKAEADPQVQASRRHADAMQQRQLFRELCRAYGLNQPSREALKALARVGGVKKLTYAAVNQAVRDRGYNPVDLAVADAVGGFIRAAA